MPEEKKLKLPTKYCESIYQTIRRPTRTIQIGKVETGSAHPVRLQTMTTTGKLCKKCWRSLGNSQQVQFVGCQRCF